jgi:hypothetical protein
VALVHLGDECGLAELGVSDAVLSVQIGVGEALGDVGGKLGDAGGDGVIHLSES